MQEMLNSRYKQLAKQLIGQVLHMSPRKQLQSQLVSKYCYRVKIIEKSELIARQLNNFMSKFKSRYFLLENKC